MTVSDPVAARPEPSRATADSTFPAEGSTGRWPARARDAVRSSARARCWVDQTTARRAAVYAALFPVGYVFSMVYPEALVLAAIAIAGVLASRGRWGGAAVAAALAALTRPEALLLVLPLAFLAARQWP